MKKTTLIASTLASTAVVGSILTNTAFANSENPSENSWQQIHTVAVQQGFTWTENIAYYLQQKIGQPNNNQTIKPIDQNTTKKSDTIVVSDWYYGITNLIFNLTDKSYAFLGHNKSTQEFDLDNLKNLSHLFSTLVYNGNTIQKDKPITDLSLKDGTLRHVEATASGSKLKYDDITSFSTLQVGNTEYNILEFENQFLYDGRYTTGINIIKKTSTQSNGYGDETLYYVEKDGKAVSGDLRNINDIFSTENDIWVSGQNYSGNTKVYKNGVLVIEGDIFDFAVSSDGKNYAYFKQEDGTEVRYINGQSYSPVVWNMYINGKLYKEFNEGWIYGMINTSPVYTYDDTTLMQGDKVLTELSGDTVKILVSGDTVYTVYSDKIIAYKDDKKYTYVNPHKNTEFYPYYSVRVLGDKIFLVEEHTITKKLRSVTIPLSEIIR